MNVEIKDAFQVIGSESTEIELVKDNGARLVQFVESRRQRRNKQNHRRGVQFQLQIVEKGRGRCRRRRHDRRRNRRRVAEWRGTHRRHGSGAFGIFGCGSDTADLAVETGGGGGGGSNALRRGRCAGRSWHGH